MKRTLISALFVVFLADFAVARTLRVDATDFNTAIAVDPVSAMDVVSVIISYDPTKPISVIGNRREFAVSSVLLGLNAVPAEATFLEGTVAVQDAETGSFDARDLLAASILGLAEFGRISFSAVDLDPESFLGFVPTAQELNALEFSQFTVSPSRRISADSIVFSEVEISVVPLPQTWLLLLSAFAMLNFRQRVRAYFRSITNA